MRLTMQNQRIDGASDVVNRSIADDLNLACIGIDFDFAKRRVPAARRRCRSFDRRRRAPLAGR
jgi:hypothetical protein